MGRFVATLIIVIFVGSWLSDEDANGIRAFDAIMQAINPAWSAP